MDEKPFRIDSDYDTGKASRGGSRYSSYVRDREVLFAEAWDGSWEQYSCRVAKFAAAAWRVATPPVMAPGYVGNHPRVLSSRVGLNPWNGGIAGTVALAAPQPAPLAASHRWRGGLRWRDWPVDAFGARFAEPTDQEVAQDAFLVTTSTLAFPVPAGNLPRIPAGPDDSLETLAHRTVRQLVFELNLIVGPALEILEQG